MGLDTATAARVAWLGRMTAARDAALGAGALSSVLRGRSPAPWLLAGAAADVADAAVVASAMRDRRVGGLGAAGSVAVAVGAAALGVWAAVSATRRR
jgi:hypothetical protein